jgi:hypothetical protein
VGLDIDRHLRDVETQLTGGNGIHFSSTGLTATDAPPLLYQPSAPSSRLASSSALADAEAAEYQRNDLADAVAAYARIASSADPHVRAASLLALGRVHRKSGNRERALQAYADLEALGNVRVADQPAALVAGQARGRLFEEAGDRIRLQQEATRLGQALDRGGWSIDRATFDVYRELVQRWGGPPPSAAALARTEAAVRLWRAWRAGELPSNGRRVLDDGTRGILAVWTGGSERPVALAGYA